MAIMADPIRAGWLEMLQVLSSWGTQFKLVGWRCSKCCHHGGPTSSWLVEDAPSVTIMADPIRVGCLEMLQVLPLNSIRLTKYFFNIGPYPGLLMIEVAPNYKG
ncbi:hypothetical protein AMTR_s00096p00076910 [Amborella trichopoda]|uniref:Uncharacterized protein n=1 Tax=Amborella trichopoda TaxID=13333 RepID=W1P3Z1_AMBTC|nr:hypothetical protein AMTR_s00096p00076910 [Amborella trichopoda]